MDTFDTFIPLNWISKLRALSPLSAAGKIRTSHKCVNTVDVGLLRFFLFRIIPHGRHVHGFLPQLFTVAVQQTSRVEFDSVSPITQKHLDWDPDLGTSLVVIKASEM